MFGNSIKTFYDMDVVDYLKYLDRLNRKSYSEVESQNIAIYFEKDLVEFLELLFDPKYDLRPNYRKYLLNQTAFVRLIGSRYFDKSVYKNDPVIYIMNCIRYFNLTTYFNKGYSYLFTKLNSYLNMRSLIDVNTKEIIIEVDSYKKLNEFKEDVIEGHINASNKDSAAEYRAYNEELDILDGYFESCKNTSLRFTKHLSRNIGDGVGYDLLSFNPMTGKEKLIEVKSSFSENFFFSENEYYTAKHPLDGVPHEYYIYVYNYSKGYQNPTKSTYVYDEERDCFYDINNPNRGFVVGPFEHTININGSISSTTQEIKPGNLVEILQKRASNRLEMK